MATFIQFTQAGPIATITLDRPDKRNAFNTPMAYELESAIDRVESDPDIRVAVLARLGHRAAFRSFARATDVTEGIGDEHGGLTERGWFSGHHPSRANQTSCCRC